MITPVCCIGVNGLVSAVLLYGGLLVCLLFFKGTTGRIPCKARMNILTTFFHVFLKRPLGYRFGSFGFILGCFGSQFVSILEALGRKNEAGNATPTPKGPNPKFAYSYTVFTVFFISKPSQKSSRSRQNPLKINNFCNIHSRSYFFLF